MNRMAHTLGKGEVESSILSHSTINPQQIKPNATSPEKLLCAGLGTNDSRTEAQIRHNPFCIEDLRESDSRWREPTWLYRYFNHCDVLLYVGVSFSPLMRDEAHYRRTAWRHAAKRMAAELFPSRTLAELAEKQAIHNEDPMVNVKRMAPYPYAGIADAWFIDQQGGLIGMRKTECEIDGPRLAVKVARTI